MGDRRWWLVFGKDAYPREIRDGLYRIEFIGRRTKVPGYFGHLNTYEHMVIVDRLISIRTIPGETYQKRF